MFCVISNIVDMSRIIKFYNSIKRITSSVLKIKDKTKEFLKNSS